MIKLIAVIFWWHIVSDYYANYFNCKKDKVYITIKIYHRLCSMRQFYITFQLGVPFHTFNEKSRLQLSSMFAFVCYLGRRKD
jgi:hypothetical protein